MEGLHRHTLCPTGSGFRLEALDSDSDSESVSSNDVPLPIRHTELYVNTIGKQHGRVRGLGQLGKPRRITSNSNSNSSSISIGTYSQSDVDRLLQKEREKERERSQKLIEEVHKEMKKEIKRRQIALREELTANMQRQFTEWLQEMQCSLPSGGIPQRPSGSDHSSRGSGGSRR